LEIFSGISVKFWPFSVQKVQNEKGKKLKDFEAGLQGNTDVLNLKAEVEAWASSFGYPGL